MAGSCGSAQAQQLQGTGKGWWQGAGASHRTVDTGLGMLFGQPLSHVTLQKAHVMEVCFKVSNSNDTCLVQWPPPRRDVPQRDSPSNWNTVRDYHVVPAMECVRQHLASFKRGQGTPTKGKTNVV